jgi:hypothetical protein
LLSLWNLDRQRRAEYDPPPRLPVSGNSRRVLRLLDESWRSRLICLADRIVSTGSCPRLGNPPLAWARSVVRTVILLSLLSLPLLYCGKADVAFKLLSPKSANGTRKRAAAITYPRRIKRQTCQRVIRPVHQVLRFPFSQDAFQRPRAVPVAWREWLFES